MSQAQIVKELEKVFTEYHLDTMDKDYKMNILKLVKLAKKVFKNNLLSIMLAGSGGKNKIIAGWSDLDFYIVLRKVDMTIVNKFYHLLNTETSKIHLGITFYQKWELDQGLYDNKTKMSLLERKYYDVNPIIYGEDVFPEVSKEEIKKSDRQNLPNMIHIIRRLYLEEVKNKVVSKAYIKKLTVLIRCFLSTKDVFVYGYENIYNHFAKVTNTRPLAILKIIKTRDSKEIMSFTKNLLENILKEDLWKKELV